MVPSEKNGLLNTIDWSSTSLGPVSEWPETLEFSIRTIINSPLPMTILWGEDSIAIYNDAFADFIGNKHPDLFGKPFQETWPELENLSNEAVNTCFYNGKSASYINHPISVFRNNKNENLRVNIHCSPITDGGKLSLGVLIVLIDQSEKVLSEQGRKRAEELFDVAMDAAGMVGIWEWDLHSDIIYADPRLSTLLSTDPKKFESGSYASDYFDHLHPEDVEPVKTNIKKAIEQREKFSMEYRLLQKDGSVRWILSRAKCHYDSNGKPVRLVGVAVEITEQKETQKALLESEFQFRRIAESNIIGIMIWDINGQALEANQAFLDMLGYSNDELKEGKVNWIKLTPKEFYEKDQDAMEQLKEKGSFRPFEKQYIKKDGSRLNVIVGGALYEGSTTKGIAWILDITDRKRMEEALRKSEYQYRAIADSIPSIVWTTKPDGYHDYYNKRWYDFVGKSFSETKGQNWSFQFHPEDQERARKRWQHSLDTGEPYEIEYRLRSKDGSYRWFLGQALPFRDDKTGQIIRWFGTCTDIHDLKLAQAALAKSEEQLSRVIDGSNDGIWEWDFKNDVAWWNERFNEIIGRKIPVAEQSYKSLLPFILEEDRDILPRAVDTFLKGDEKLELVYRIARPNGEVRHLLIKGKGVLDSLGHVTILSGTVTDITEQKRWEEHLKIKNDQLTRINNDLDNFVYTAAHDLRSPIANVEGLMRILSGKIDLSDPEASKINGLIMISLDRLKRTIGDLTEIAKVSGTTDPGTELSFSEILDEVKLNIQNLIEESNAQIIEDFSEAPVINFSKKNLRSILYNLVSNAIKYRSPIRPVRVKVMTANVDNYILLTVEDNGTGIKERDKEKVFQMFKRFHLNVEGTGIGLAIVKKIVDNNGGRIEVESQEGKGTTFKIYLKV